MTAARKLQQPRVASARTIANRLAVRIEVAREIRAAFIAGQNMTPLRPFLDIDERLGAMRCCRRVGGHPCRWPSTHVTYLVGFSGRLVYCDTHAQQRPEVVTVVETKKRRRSA